MALSHSRHRPRWTRGNETGTLNVVGGRWFHSIELNSSYLAADIVPSSPSLWGWWRTWCLPLPYWESHCSSSVLDVTETNWWALQCSGLKPNRHMVPAKQHCELSCPPQLTVSDAWFHLLSENSTFHVADNDSHIVAPNNRSPGLSVQGAVLSRYVRPLFYVPRNTFHNKLSCDDISFSLLDNRISSSIFPSNTTFRYCPVDAQRAQQDDGRWTCLRLWKLP